MMAFFLAGYELTDFIFIELDSTPDPAWSVS
jgi:hypothetical protein